MPSPRDTTIDIARGIAIVIMIGANMGPILSEPHSLLMRLYSSLAAPMFVTLAGMMLARGGKSWRDITFRALMLLAVATFVDMAAWNIRPFLGVDVLYLLAIGTVITYALRNVSTNALISVSILIAVAAPALQDLLGYTAYPTEQSLLTGAVTVPVAGQTPVWHHYIIDGWFPLFPWLAFMLAGFVLGRRRFSGQRFASTGWLKALLLCLMWGGGLWMLAPGIMLDRQGFSELFYPPTVGFCLTALGLVMAALMLAEVTEDAPFWRPIALMGRHSLFIYVLHSLVIGRVFNALFANSPLATGGFLLLYAIFAAAMYLAALLWHKLRKA